MRNLLFALCAVILLTILSNSVATAQDTRKEKHTVEKVMTGKGDIAKAKQYKYLLLYTYKIINFPSFSGGITFTEGTGGINQGKIKEDTLMASEIFMNDKELSDFLNQKNNLSLYSSPQKYEEIIAIYRLDWTAENFIPFTVTDFIITKPYEEKIIQKEETRKETIIKPFINDGQIF